MATDELDWLDELVTEGQICASQARSEYRIPESVLRPLECDHWPNPHYLGAAPMRMYIRQQVLQAAVPYHEKKIASEKLRAEKRQVQEERAAQRAADGEDASPR